MPSKTKTKVVKLVGKQCVVHCYLDNVSVEVLWDTVAQVSIVHSNWQTINFPGLRTQSISELTGGGFDVKSASAVGIPILGWVPLRFKLDSTEESDLSPFIVHFLVSDIVGLDRPILGFNVIVEPVIGNALSAVISQLGCASDVPSHKVEVLSECLGKELPEQICSVKTGKIKSVIPPDSSSVLKVSVHAALAEASLTAVFVPKVESVLPDNVELHESVVWLKCGSTSQIGLLISNNTYHQVTIPAKTNLGFLETVKSVVEVLVEIPEHSYQLQVNKGEPEVLGVDSLGFDKQGLGSKSTGELSKSNINLTPCRIDVSKGESTKVSGGSILDEWEPQIDLDGCGLAQDQIFKVRQVLREECSAFVKDEDDIGTVPDLELGIRLTDEVLVKHSYMSIPRPFFDEVKDDLKGLLAKGWVNKSRFTYSCQIVRVQKKESSSETSEYPLMVNGGKFSKLSLSAEPFSPMGETAKGELSEPTAAPDHVSSNDSVESGAAAEGASLSESSQSDSGSVERVSDETASSSVSDSEEQPGTRRSRRQHHQPEPLTDDSLGEPVSSQWLPEMNQINMQWRGGHQEGVFW